MSRLKCRTIRTLSGRSTIHSEPYENLTLYFWLILTDFDSFYIVLIVKKFYMQL